MMHATDERLTRHGDSAATSSAYSKARNGNTGSGVGGLGGRLNTGSSNRQVYFQVNLQDLDAYTQQVLEAERARRRYCLCRMVSALLVVSVIASGGIYTWLFPDQVKGPWGLNQTLNNNEIITECERQLLGNMTFDELVSMIHEDPADTKRCRSEADVCVWQNPTVPRARGISEGWTEEFLHNKEQIASWMEQPSDSGKVLDVVLIGDSLIEHKEGKELGKERTDLKRDHEIFQELFNKDNGSEIDGLAMGIGGDRCANLLYRLTNGELNAQFAPKVWWIVVGGQDWDYGSSPQAIVAGIVAIVNAIRNVHPTNQIVINSLLPRQVDNMSIQQVNQMLECYVNSQQQRQQQMTEHPQPNLHFFNATDIFLKQNEFTGEYEVNAAFMLADEKEDPDAHGEFLWGEKIVETVQELTKEDSHHQHHRHDRMRRLGK